MRTAYLSARNILEEGSNRNENGIEKVARAMVGVRGKEAGLAVFVNRSCLRHDVSVVSASSSLDDLVLRSTLRRDYRFEWRGRRGRLWRNGWKETKQ